MNKEKFKKLLLRFINFTNPLEIINIITIFMGGITIIILLNVILFFQNTFLFWSILFFSIIVIIFLYKKFISFLIEIFIQSKLRVIYKAIHFLRVNRIEDSFLQLDLDKIDKFENNIFSIIRENKKEIENLKKRESYRKEFVGNLSHELKTPIFAIQGLLLTLLEGGLEDPKINKNYLIKADKNLDRLIYLIEELDMITKLELGQYPLQFKNYDVIEIINDAISNLEYEAKAKAIIFKLVPFKLAPINVYADKNKIYQVCVNLFSNAIKYGVKNGSIRIKIFDFNDQILIEIKDDGIGIKKEYIPRLFERFYKIDKSGSRKFGGSGLGLSIVKHIVEGHRQSINVSSEFGKGTTFSFTLAKAKD